MIDTTYVIVPTVEITDSMIESSINDIESLRYSNDKSLVILKFNTKFPDVMQGYKKYNHDEILVEIGKPEWVTE